MFVLYMYIISSFSRPSLESYHVSIKMGEMRKTLGYNPPPKNSNFAKHYIDEDNKTIITTSVMRELIKLIASLSPLQEKETEVNMAPTCLTLYN